MVACMPWGSQYPKSFASTALMSRWKTALPYVAAAPFPIRKTRKTLGTAAQPLARNPLEWFNPPGEGKGP
eukprot:1140393-Alexandrium_andersonii.AAC.1